MMLHTGGVRLTVWIDDWQHECCGQPFSIGSTLHWTLGEPDESVGLLFGPDLSVHVDREEDRHYVLTEIGAPETVGTVTAIRSVHVRHAQDPDDERAWYRVPGSAELTELDRTNGDELQSRSFAGYLVEILVPDNE